MQTTLILLVLASCAWGKSFLPQDSELKDGFSMERTFPVVNGASAFLKCVAANKMKDKKSCSFQTPSKVMLQLDLETGMVTNSSGVELTGFNAVGDDSMRVCQLNIAAASDATLGQWECKLNTVDGTFEAGRIAMLTAEQGYVRDVRLPRHVIPSDYDLSLTPFILENNFTIDGSVNIKAMVDITDPAYEKVIVLHTVKTEINEVSVTQGGAAVQVDGVGFDLDRNFLMIFTKTKLVNGEITIDIKFTSQLSDDLAGFYRSTYVDSTTNTTKMIATTQFESTDARKAFPCFDEPAMKANFTVHLGRRNDMISLSNMKLVDTEDLGNGYVMDNYKTSVKMSTYLLAFIVCEFKSTHAEGHENFKIWAQEDRIKYLGYAAEIGPKITAHYEELFDQAFPLEKMDMAAIPDFQSGAMENWGLITYRDSALFYSDDEFTQSNRQRVAVVVAHELAHQWFGNLVTMKWWNDLWLNEGFASYVEYLGTDHVAPEMAMREQVINIDMHDVFYLDSLPSSHPISIEVENPPYDENFDRISYGKGSVMIRMMEDFLSTETFLKGLRKYFVDHKYSNAEQDDLWEALGTFWSSTGVTVKQVMDTWTTQKGYPVVNVRIADSKTWELEQQKFNLEIELDRAEDSLWWVPVRYQQVGAANSKLFWLNDTKATLKSDMDLRNSTFVFNVDQMGYYRVNYEVDYWKRLTSAYDQLSNLNRAQVLDDSINLARAGQLNYSVALDVLLQIRDEMDYIPLVAAESSMVFLDRMIRNSDDNQKYDDMKAVVRDLLTKVYAEVETSFNSTEFLKVQRRALIMKWACYVGAESCRAQASEKFQAWKVAVDYESSVNPNEKEWVYCNGIRTGTTEDWDLAYDRLMKTQVLSERFGLMRGLACTEDQEQLKKYLDKSIDPASTIRMQDKRYMYSAIGKGDAAGGRTMFQWVEDNYSEIKAFYQDQFVYNLKVILSGFPEEASTEADKTRLQTFLDLHRADLGSAITTINEGLDKISANIKWRSKSYSAVTQWFTDHVPEEIKSGSEMGSPSIALMTLLVFKLVSIFQ